MIADFYSTFRLKCFSYTLPEITGSVLAKHRSVCYQPCTAGVAALLETLHETSFLRLYWWLHIRNTMQASVHQLVSNTNVSSIIQRHNWQTSLSYFTDSVHPITILNRKQNEYQKHWINQIKTESCKIIIIYWKPSSRLPLCLETKVL